MASGNNRLGCPIPLHRNSESDRRGYKTFLRGKQARQLKRRK